MKHKILILDIYPRANYRISKDLNGGYGTANDYGDLCKYPIETYLTYMQERTDAMKHSLVKRILL